jgi:hypothetical protein
MKRWVSCLWKLLHPEERTCAVIGTGRSALEPKLGARFTMKHQSSAPGRDFRLGQQAAEIKRAGEHRQLTFGCQRPFFPGAVAVEFNPILVGIAQIKGFTDPVVGGPIQRVAGPLEAAERLRQGRTRGIKDGCVVQSRRAYRGRRAAETLPSVEPNVMVIAAGRDKRRLAAKSLHQLKTQYVTVKIKGPLQVSDFEMNMADADRRINGSKHGKKAEG